MFLKFNKLITAFALLTIVGTSELQGVLLYELSTVVSGGTPSGPTPWATATFQNVGDDVLLTMTTTNLSSGEFISKWGFNFEGGDATGLTFTRQDAPPPGTTTVSFDQNLGAGLAFDFIFNMPTANTLNSRFVNGNDLVFLISGLNPINEDMFNVLSSNGTFSVPTLAHIQGITGDPSSGFVTVPIPEPSTYLMLGSMLGLAALIAYKRRKLPAKV